MRPFRDDRYRGKSNYTPNAAPILNNQLQDLDMELEILKRQREIIKQRQMESVLMSERQNIYDYPSSSFGRFDPKDKYGSNDYQNFGSSNKVAKSFKRPSDRNWPSTSAPKQPRQVNPWQDQYDNRSNFRSQTQQIRAQAPQFKRKDKPIPKNTFKPRSDFNPTKVTKAKNLQNKPHTNVSNAAKKALTDTKAKKVFGKDEILRPFKDPTPSMKGRLELALGMITKDVKLSQDVEKPIMDQITFAGTQKQVKNLIRQRISSIMMNKIVGAPADIVALYRKSYPDVVDEEIRNIINSAPAMIRPPIIVKPISTAESGDLRAFFKSNITQLLTDKMQEMVDSISKLYGDNEKEILRAIVDLPDLEATIFESKKEETNISTDIAKAESNAETTTDNTAKDITKESDNAEENNISEENNDGTVNNIEVKSSEADKQNIEVKSSEADKQNIEVKSSEADKQDTTAKESDDKNTTAKESDEKNNTAKESDEKDESSKINQYYKLMDLLIINRLPKLLLKFKDNFANIMYCEKDFIIAKETIMKELKNKLRKSLYEANSLNIDGTKIEDNKTSPSTQVNGQSDTVCDPTPASDSKSTEVVEAEESDTAHTNTQDNVAQKTPQKINSEQLFVMLLGRPSLPPKPVIYEFLSKFNPQSIKKHKTVNNLLVINFNNKQDYDNILAANESKVGDSVFIIKANEVIPSEKPRNADVSDGGNSEKTTEKVQDGEVNEEMKAKSEIKEPENTAQTTEDNEMETIVENEENDDVQIIEEKSDITEVNNITKNNVSDEANNEVSNEAENEVSNEAKKEISNDANNEVKSVNDVNVATPVRSSSRLANVTPSTIKTRRASRLAQNN